MCLSFFSFPQTAQLKLALPLFPGLRLVLISSTTRRRSITAAFLIAIAVQFTQNSHLIERIWMQNKHSTEIRAGEQVQLEVSWQLTASLTETELPIFGEKKKLFLAGQEKKLNFRFLT